MPVEIVAITLPVFTSRRASARSPQSGTHTLPNPAARPEHGRLPTAVVAVMVLVFGSSYETVSFGSFDTHTCSSIAIQSGEPGTCKTASGLSLAIGTCTPGVATPVFGGNAGRCPKTHSTER